MHNNRYNSKSSQTIENFIDYKIKEIADHRQEFVEIEYIQTIYALFINMYNKCIMRPKWSDFANFSLTSDQLQMLRHISHQKQIFKLDEDSSSQLIIFRHDRVSDFLAAKSIAYGLSTKQLSNDVLPEPYFAKIIGLSLNFAKVDSHLINHIKSVNPLSLFYWYQKISFDNSRTQTFVLSSIEKWLQEDKTYCKSNEYLRWECLNCLAITEAPYVLKILDHFKDKIWSYYRAGFLNGDLEKGIYLCCHNSPSVNNPIFEQLVNHVISKHRKLIISGINKLLRQDNLNVHLRSGILRLSGYIRDRDLFDSLQYSWKIASIPDRIEILNDYLWACAHCCGDSPSTLLSPILDCWASLSEKDSYFMQEIHFAFQKYPPNNAIDFFIEKTEIQQLRWQITYMLHLIDHPSVVAYLSHYLAEQQRKIEDSRSFSPLSSMMHLKLKRQYEINRISMSFESRSQLYAIWSDKCLDQELRKKSFMLWSTTNNEDDIAILKPFIDDEILHDSVLKQRIALKDINALPKLLEMIKKDNNWWQFTRHFWSNELTELFDCELSRRSQYVSQNWDQVPYETDWITFELIMRLPTIIAESMLIKHWMHLQYCSHFIQAALYIATDKLVNLVSSTITDCPESKKLFQFLIIHYGIKTKGHPGITKLKQLEVLLPYMDLLEHSDIVSIWELCNTKYWVEFRKKHLDQRLQEDEFRKSKYLSEDLAIQSLNDILNQNREFSVDYWVDNYLETGESVEGIINTVFEWIKSQNKIGLNVIELSLDVILQIGSRSHFIELLDICSDVKEQYDEYFNNALFLLKRRRLK